MPLLPPPGPASPLRSPLATPGPRLSIVRSYGKGPGQGVGSWRVVPPTLTTTGLNQTTHSVTPPQPPAPNAPPRKRGSRRLRPPKALRAHSRWDHRMAPDLGANLNLGRPPPGAAPPASS